MMRFVRRLLMTLGTLSLLPLVGGAVAWLWHSDSLAEHSVLHVVLDDALPEAPPSGVSALWQQHEREHLTGLVRKLRAAAKDGRVVGLLLEVKSPKVGLAQLQEVARAVQAFRDSGKWTLGYLESAGEGGHGDGAYALASLAGEVALSPPGEINLSGMHAEVPFFADTLAKVHVDAHVERRFEYKNYANTFTETGFTPAHKESLSSLLDDLQHTLSSQLAANRRVSVEEVARWVEAAPFDAQAAHARGLVDRLWYWDEVVERVEQVAGRKDALVAIEDYTAKPPKGRGIAVAYVVGAGEISRGEGGYGDGGMAADVYVQALRQAREDGVKAVLLRIDSPGGSYLASDLIRREVAKTRAENVPVVVSMGNTAASGGYFIAAEADYIVAEAGTVTGSIGVVGASFTVGRALEHFFAVHFDRYAALPNPGTMDPLQPPSPLQAARMAAQVDRVYNDFVGKVAKARHRRFDEVHALAKGRVWTGKQALERGLVDAIGGIDAATAYLERRLEVPDTAHIELQLYPPPKSALAQVRDALEVTAQVGTTGRSLQQLSQRLTRQARPGRAELATPVALP